MLKDEKEMKSIIKEAEITNSFYNINNRVNSSNLRDNIQLIKEEISLSLEYPINLIFEFITNSMKIYTNHEKIESLSKEFEKVNYYLMKLQDRKNEIFITLKKMESEILIYESIIRNNNKQNIIINEKINKDKQNSDLKEKKFIFTEMPSDFSNFKRKSISSNNFNRKADILTSLTLKSNYSEENESNENLNGNKIKKPPLTPEHNNKPFSPDKNNIKKNETIENIIENLTRIKTEGSKTILKNVISKKKEGKNIKLKSIKTNEKYLNNNPDLAQLGAKNSYKKQNSNLFSPINGSENTSVIQKKDNKVKIKIENNLHKNVGKKNCNVIIKNKKNSNKNEKNNNDNVKKNIQNNYLQFEKMFNESSKELIKKSKNKYSGSSINNIDYSTSFLNSIKHNCIL